MIHLGGRASQLAIHQLRVSIGAKDSILEAYKQSTLGLRVGGQVTAVMAAARTTFSRPVSAPTPP